MFFSSISIPQVSGPPSWETDWKSCWSLNSTGTPATNAFEKTHWNGVLRRDQRDAVAVAPDVQRRRRGEVRELREPRSAG
jgi:hypothetical protein